MEKREQTGFECLFKCHLCTSFGWDGVDFIYSSLYSTMLWIYDENRAGNIQMFWLLMSSAYRVTLFSDSHTAPLKSKLGV